MERLFFSADRYFEAVLKDIEGAKASISIESYIYERCAITDQLSLALVRAQERGVAVKMLLDGFGCHKLDLGDLASFKFPVRFYHPLWWQEKIPSVKTVFKWANRRNHRKLILIDGEIAYVSSINLDPAHSEKLSGAAAWQDVGARVQGRPYLAFLESLFDHAWAHSSRLFTSPLSIPSIKTLLRQPVRANVTRKLRLFFQRDLTRRILLARSRVWIFTPYFVPPLTVLGALRMAAKSGVDVRLMLPARNDVFFMSWVASAYYGVLHAAGIRTYEYLPRFFHAKILCIDKFVTIGSSNFNHRSFIHDLELDLVVKSERSLSQLEDKFSEWREHSREILPAHWTQRSWTQKLFEALFSVLKFWL